MKCAITFEINVSLYSFVQKNDLILVYVHVADICWSKVGSCYRNVLSVDSSFALSQEVKKEWIKQVN